MAIWYVNAARAAVNLGTSMVAQGTDPQTYAAATDVYRLESDPYRENLALWCKQGSTVYAHRLAQAQAEQSSDPVPAARSVAAARSGLSGGGIKDGTVQFADLASSVPAAVASSPAMTSTYVQVGDAVFLPSASRTAIPATNLTPRNFRRSRAKMAAVRAGTGSMKLLLAGDSTTYGSGSGGPGSGSYPAQLISLLDQRYLPAAPGLVIPPYQGGTDPDTRWSLGTGWQTSAQGWGNNAAYKCPSGIVTATTFTPGINCDTFDIWYIRNGSFGTISASIDGGAATTQSAAGTAAVQKFTITATAGSSHVLSITGSAGDIFILGVDAYLSTLPAIRVANAGVSTTTSANWAGSSAAYSSIGTITAYAPDLMVLMLGINDAGAGVSDTTFDANIAAIVTAAQTSGDVILMSQVPTDPTYASGIYATNEALYRAKLAARATTQGCGYVDIASRFGSFAAANAAGKMFDVKHPVSAGYADIASAVFAALAWL